ncbi:MAG: sensor histidine kinase [Clostridia bacterium]|nr:sensor histidine kinase [Clostridia bacterium]
MNESGLLFDLRHTVRRRKLFILCLTFVLLLFLLDAWTVGSFVRSFFFGGGETEFISTLVLEDWFACIGYIFLFFLYLFLLVAMTVQFLGASLREQFLPCPFFLLWHSAIGLFCAVADIGHYSMWKSFFVSVSDPMKAASMLPVLLCMVFWMKKYQRILLPLTLVSGLSVSFCLLVRSMDWMPDLWPVFRAVDDGLFLVCVLACLVFALIDRKQGNPVFRRLPAILLFLLAVAGVLLGFMLLLNRTVPGIRHTILIPSESVLHGIRYHAQYFLLGTVLMLVVLTVSDASIRRRVEEKAVETRYAANEEYAESLHRYEQNVRELKHDLSHQLQVASMLCRDGKIDELQEYLDSLNCKVSETTGKTYCAHTLSNYILQMFAQRFEEKDIAFECEAFVPWDLKLSDRDLTSMLDNLLSNALEAAETAPEGFRWAKLRVTYEQKVLRIRCTNSYGAEPQTDADGVIRTRKFDRKSHGFGLRIVRKTAESAGGAATVSYGNGIFEVKVAVPVAE